MKKYFKYLAVLMGFVMAFSLTGFSVSQTMADIMAADSPTTGEVIGAESPGAGDDSGDVQDTNGKYEDFEYEVNEDGSTITIVKYAGAYNTTINVPAEINGMKVTVIGEKAFENAYGCCINIPEGVTTIKKYAFYCSQAAKIYFPSTIVNVEGEDDVFYTHALRTQVYGYKGNIIETIANIDSDWNYCVFYALDEPDPVYNGLSYKINDDDTITISGYVGSDNEVEIPSKIDGRKVTCIGRYAFSGSNVTKVTMNTGIKKISKYAFYRCEDLTEINIPDGVVEIGAGAFSGDSFLEKLIIPASVADCSNSTFHIGGRRENAPVTVGALGSGCNIEYGWTTEIPSGAFCSAPTITDVWISDTITSIGDCAFSCCYNLKNIYMSDSVTSIGKYAFISCPIEEITIPSGVDMIPEKAFKDCGSLTDVTILGGAAVIESDAFNNCTNLTTIHGLTGSSAELFAKENGYAFESVGVYVDPTEPDSGSGSENNVWSYTVNDDETLTLTAYTGSLEPNASVTIPSVIDGKKVTTIGTGVFPQGTILSEIVITEGVTTIKQGAFSNTGVSKILIPATVISLEEGSLYCISSAAEERESWTAGPVGSGCNIEYAWDTGIPANAFYGSKLTDIKFMDTLEFIGINAFRDCNLTTVILPDGVTGVGEDAFNDCAEVTKLVIPASVANVGNRSFAVGLSSEGDNRDGRIPFTAGPIGSGCNIEFGWTDKIPAYAFGHANITDITLPDTITSFGEGAFTGCWLLREITLPADLTELAMGSLSSCGFESITIPDGVKYIDVNVFYGCGALKEVIIPSGVERIGWGAFARCSGLNSIELPESVKTIDKYAFSGCERLADITIPSGEVAFGENVFNECSADLCIKGLTNSTSETYANDTGIKFESIGVYVKPEEPTSPSGPETEAPMTASEKPIDNSVIEQINRGDKVVEQTVEAGSYVPEAVVTAVIDKGAKLVLEVKGTNGKLVATYTIDGSKFDRAPDSDLKLGVTCGEKNDVTEKVKEQLQTEDNSIFLCDFAHTGELNGKLDVTVYPENYDKGTVFELFYYNEAAGRAEDMKQTVTMAEDGSVTFTVTHFSSYLLVKAEDIKTGTYTAPSTGFGSSSALVCVMLTACGASGVCIVRKRSRKS